MQRTMLVIALLAVSVSSAQAMPSKKDLEGKKVEDLKALCKDKGLTQTGIKADLVERLLEHFAKAGGSWTRVREDAHCSNKIDLGIDFNLVACQNRALLDSSCGAFIHSNAPKGRNGYRQCYCVPSGESCDFASSSQGNNVYQYQATPTQNATMGSMGFTATGVIVAVLALFSIGPLGKQLQKSQATAQSTDNKTTIPKPSAPPLSIEAEIKELTAAKQAASAEENWDEVKRLTPIITKLNEQMKAQEDNPDLAYKERDEDNNLDNNFRSNQGKHKN